MKYLSCFEEISNQTFIKKNYFDLDSVEYKSAIMENLKLKSATWQARMYKNWQETIKVLEREKFKPLCENCYSIEQTKIS